MIKYILYFIIISSFIMLSCGTNETDNNKHNPIAKFNDDYLYLDDVFIPENIDSLTYIQSYIDDWVMTRMLFIEADKNLPNESKSDFNGLVQEYKNQLYINSYKELFIKQNIDTNISAEEINKFYNENIGNYKLEANVIKAIYIKIPIKAPKVYKVRKWLKSNKPEDLEKLSTYCTEHSDKFDGFNGDWIYFNDVLQFFPKKISNQKSILKYKKLLEAKDSLFYYYIDIDKYKLINDTTPVFFVKNEIVDNILKKRKKELIKQMEQDLFNDISEENIIEKY